MASFIEVHLDTTAPTIQIYAPSYTTKEAINRIIIESNEKLDNYQEIYVIDSRGERYNYNFFHESDNIFIGQIQFMNLIGIVTIYARMKDEVGNLSNLVSKSIEVKEYISLLNVKISDKQMNITNKHKSQNITISNRTNIITTNIIKEI